MASLRSFPQPGMAAEAANPSLREFLFEGRGRVIAEQTVLPSLVRHEVRSKRGNTGYIRIVRCCRPFVLRFEEVGVTRKACVPSVFSGLNALVTLVCG